MSHPITTQDELNIISLYARGYSQREICKKLNHGRTQVSRTLQVDDLCYQIAWLLQEKDLLEFANQELQRQIKSLRIYTLLSLLVGLIIGILI